MRNLAVIILFLLLVLSCAKKEEETATPNVEQFFQVYTTFLELSRSDSLAMRDKSDLLDSALTMHEMDAEAFDSTLVYFENHPDVFLEEFEKFDTALRAAKSAAD